MSCVSPAALALNTWTHLATSYDGTTMRLYVNGTQVATRAQTGALATSDGPLRFGGNTVWAASSSPGRLDELRVYNRALTAAEVAADVTRPVGPGRAAASSPSRPRRCRSAGSRRARSRPRKTLAVANDGGGSLAFTASDDAPWLSVTPGSGSAPQTLTVTANTAGLTAGTYTGTVTVAAPGRDGRAGRDPGDADRHRAGAAGAGGRARLARLRGDGGRRARRRRRRWR